MKTREIIIIVVALLAIIGIYIWYSTGLANAAKAAANLVDKNAGKPEGEDNGIKATNDFNIKFDLVKILKGIKP